MKSFEILNEEEFLKVCKSLFEQSKDAFYVTSRDGMMLQFNQSLLELFGYDKKEMKGKDIKELYVNPDDRLQFQAEIERTGTVKDYELKLRKNDGAEIECLVSSIIRTDEKGNVLGYQGIIRDITEKKRMEKELQKRNENILNMIRIVAHDIKGPLASIGGTLKRVVKGRYGAIDESVKIKLDELYKRELYLEGVVINHLVKSSVFGDIKMPPKEELDLSVDIIDPVLDALSQKIEEYQVKINACLGEIPSQKILLKGKKIWLQSVYYNLFDNAIKYGGQGVTIALGYKDCDDYICLNVYNDGPAIPDDKKDLIFEPFGRIELEKEGVGIGLFAAKQLIEAHGGKIWYETTSDGHPNFIFTIPKESF